MTPINSTHSPPVGPKAAAGAERPGLQRPALKDSGNLVEEAIRELNEQFAIVGIQLILKQEPASANGITYTLSCTGENAPRARNTACIVLEAENILARLTDGEETSLKLAGPGTIELEIVVDFLLSVVEVLARE